MARLLTQIGYFQKPQPAPQFIQPPAPSYRPYAKGREYQPFQGDDVRGRYMDPIQPPNADDAGATSKREGIGNDR